MNFESKVVIVTGAGKGIGEGIAKAFASAKARVVLSDIDIESCERVVSEIKSSGGEAIAIKCDVSKKIEVDQLLAKTLESFQKIDVLVNNAGIYPFKNFSEMTEEEWDRVIDINLKSVFLCSQSAAKNMPEGGKIVNISSIASIIGFRGLTHYCSSKGGVDSLTRVLALELAPKINVNAIAPGSIETPGTSQVSNEEMKKQTLAVIPLGRMGKPEDIANVALFLASDEANYITGQVLVVDGGWTLQ